MSEPNTSLANDMVSIFFRLEINETHSTCFSVRKRAELQMEYFGFSAGKITYPLNFE